MEHFVGGDADIFSLSKFLMDSNCSLSLMDFILSVDTALPPNLSDRLHHLGKIVEQSFNVIIEPHRMFDILTILKQKSTNGKDLLHHNKSIEEELNKYSSNAIHLSEHPKSVPFCLPFIVTPNTDHCPQ